MALNCLDDGACEDCAAEAYESLSVACADEEVDLDCPENEEQVEDSGPDAATVESAATPAQDSVFEVTSATTLAELGQSIVDAQRVLICRQVYVPANMLWAQSVCVDETSGSGKHPCAY